jgi:predicted transcriptional regulator
MLLKQYIEKYKIDPVKFALDCNIRPSSIYSYLNGKRKPLQKKAEMIEKMSDGLVTVKELRGKDDRERRKRLEDVSNGGS